MCSLRTYNVQADETGTIPLGTVTACCGKKQAIGAPSGVDAERQSTGLGPGNLDRRTSSVQHQVLDSPCKLTPTLLNCDGLPHTLCSLALSKPRRVNASRLPLPISFGDLCLYCTRAIPQTGARSSHCSDETRCVPRHLVGKVVLGPLGNVETKSGTR